MSKNRMNSKGGRRGNTRSGRAGTRHKLNVRASSKKASRARWGSRGRVAFKWGGAAALILFLGFGVSRAIGHFLYESPKFKVAVIDYETDGFLTRARVLAAADVETGTNILRVDLEDVRERILAALPVVKNVEIIRDLPDRLALNVVERHPVAWLADVDRAAEPQKRRDGLLLDAEGVVVPCERLEPQYIDLPVIFSDEYPTAAPGRAVDCKPVRAALGLIAEAGEAFADSPVELAELRVANSYWLVGKLNTGAEITFGLDDFGRQIDDLQVILAETTRRGRTLATANVMVKKNIPVRFVEQGAEARYPRPVPRAELVAAPAPAPLPAGDTVRRAVPEPERPRERRRVYRSVSRRDAADDPAVRSILRVD